MRIKKKIKEHWLIIEKIQYKEPYTKTRTTTKCTIQKKN